MQQVVQCPLLLYIASTMLWNEIVGFPGIRHLLDVSWDEVRAALCRLRPILHNWLQVANLCEFPALLIHDWMSNQQRGWRAKICIQLAWGCFRLRKLINTGRLPENVWWVSQGESDGQSHSFTGLLGSFGVVSSEPAHPTRNYCSACKNLCHLPSHLVIGE
jgi:hypothetical protein